MPPSSRPERLPPRTFGSGSGTTHLYLVEARATFGEIVLELSPMNNQTGHLILTVHEWKRIHTTSARIGIPNRVEFYHGAAEHGLMTYQCAMAVACWLQAEHDRGGLETRLVQVEFTYSFSTKELGLSVPLNLAEDDRQLLWKLQDERKALEADEAVEDADARSHS